MSGKDEERDEHAPEREADDDAAFDEDDEDDRDPRPRQSGCTGRIDLELAYYYQCEVVWSKAKQMEIMHLIYTTFTCRRLFSRRSSTTTARRHAYREPTTRKLWCITVPDDKKALIPQHGRKLFVEKVITCVEYRHRSMSAKARGLPARAYGHRLSSVYAGAEARLRDTPRMLGH
ncbi:hypothetical protein FA95DRAFT_1608131 [Auriscalpium vulgare]|uniref:Uncharacterized protein n=1 Tax=Auriscalpium vulgare TaxID=40419 RepID=A0ACB8RLS1_9AGAM|nr:hypothetical protein FA95DRAFT_1608131 [Auriscalpium vulgare]